MSVRSRFFTDDLGLVIQRRKHLQTHLMNYFAGMLPIIIGQLILVKLRAVVVAKVYSAGFYFSLRICSTQLFNYSMVCLIDHLAYQLECFFHFSFKVD